MDPLKNTQLSSDEATSGGFIRDGFKASAKGQQVCHVSGNMLTDIIHMIDGAAAVKGDYSKQPSDISDALLARDLGLPNGAIERGEDIVAISKQSLDLITQRLRDANAIYQRRVTSMIVKPTKIHADGIGIDDMVARSNDVRDMYKLARRGFRPETTGPIMRVLIAASHFARLVQ